MSTAEIKKLLGNEKLLIGTDKVMKNLRQSKVTKVFLSSNANPLIVDEIKHLSTISDVKVEELDIPNDELGGVCKKTFSVSIIGILK